MAATRCRVALAAAIATGLGVLGAWAGEPRGRIVTFPEALRIARTQHPAMRAAGERTAAAAARIDAVSAARLPSVAAAASAGLGVADVPVLPEVRFRSGVTLIDASVTAHWLISDFGRTQNAEAAARSGLVASRCEEQVAARQAMLEAGVRYLDVLGDQEAIASAALLVEQREAHLRVLDELIRAGNRPETERLRADLSIESAKFDVTVLEAKELSDCVALAGALGLDPTISIAVAPIDTRWLEVDDDPTRAVTVATSTRPEISAARARAGKADAEVALARAQDKPIIALLARADASHTELIGGFGPSGIAVNAGLAAIMSWPALDWSVEPNARAAQSEALEALERVRAEELAVASETAQAALAVRSARVLLKHSQRILGDAVHHRELSDERFRYGSASQLDILDAQAAEQDARFSVLRSRLALYISSVRLILATEGTHYGDRLDQPPAYPAAPEPTP